jgi:hypothetical protein
VPIFYKQLMPVAGRINGERATDFLSLSPHKQRISSCDAERLLFRAVRPKVFVQSSRYQRDWTKEILSLCSLSHLLPFSVPVSALSAVKNIQIKTLLG